MLSMVDLTDPFAIDFSKHLIEKGADVNRAKHDGTTPLYSAVSDSRHIIHNERELDLVKLLLEKGADINMATDIGWTHLYKAVVDKNLEIVNILLEKGADINKADNNGFTPVMMAIDNKNMEIVKILVEKGVDINKTDNNGWTPLNRAVNNKNLEIVRYLCKTYITSPVSLVTSAAMAENLWKGVVESGSMDIGESLLLTAITTEHVLLLNAVFIGLNLEDQIKLFGMKNETQLLLKIVDGKTMIGHIAAKGEVMSKCREDALNMMKNIDEKIP